MKKSVFLALALAVILSIPAASYALIDAGVYGGYAFGGRVDESGTDTKPEGGEIGAFAHYWWNIIPTAFDIGLGGFYQRSFEKYSINSTDYDFNRDIIGISGYAELTLIPVIHPFVRGTVNVWDNVSGSDYAESTSYFTTYSVGGGVFFKIFPMVSLFGEYLYTFGERAGSEIRGSAIHGGVRIKI